jgi:hypothetical protein
MKITEDYLIASGFHRFCGGFSKSHKNPTWNVSIRPTVGDASWQLSCFVCSTKEFGIYEDNPAPDTNCQSVLGCVTDIEQIEQAMKFCGIHTAWREKIPFSIVRSGGKFKLHQYEDGKNLFTGFETTDYNTAMAEMKRRNIEFTTKNEEQ